MAVLINLVLAVAAFYLYVVASRRFYRRERPFVGYLGAAVFLDVADALLASFKITPTTTLPGPHVVPWHSALFLVHIAVSTVGMFGFIAVLLVVLIKGQDKPYDRMRTFQYRVLLPCWVFGEIIALANSIGKILFKVRIYDYFRF
jgi:hypothetical protein